MSPLLHLSRLVACLGMLSGSAVSSSSSSSVPVVFADVHSKGSDPIWFPRGGRPRHSGRPVSVFARADTSRMGPRDAQTEAPPSRADVPLDNKIPLDILRKLSDVENITYFLNNFVDTDTLEASDIGSGLENRFGGTDERKSFVSAKAAICQPQLEVVSLMVTTDPTMYYYPSCTRIERCGGCCGSNLLACQPIDTEIVNFKVLRLQYTGSPQMQLKGNDIISLERHTKCKCDCIKKETDCNQLQEYRKNECDCICKNVDEEHKCRAQFDIKEWDASSCSCKCRETNICVTNSYFDHESCSCTQMSAIRGRRRETHHHDSTS